MKKTKVGIKQKWLGLILKLSNYIYQQKSKLFFSGLIKNIFLLAYIVFLEVLLAIISLPLYFFLVPTTNDAFKQGNIVAYKLRQKVTLGALIIFLVTEALKAILGFTGIVIFPKFSEAKELQWDLSNASSFSYDSKYFKFENNEIIFNPTSKIEDKFIEESFKNSETEVEKKEDTKNTSNEMNTKVNQISDQGNDAELIDPELRNDDKERMDSEKNKIEDGAENPDESDLNIKIPEEQNTESKLEYEIIPEETENQAAHEKKSKNFLLASITGNENQSESKALKTCTGILQATVPLETTDFLEWEGFNENADKENGEIYYQISLNKGLDWLYFDGQDWSNAQPDQYNTADVVNVHFNELSGENNGLLFRAFFVNECQNVIRLKSITVDYRKKEGMDHEEVRLITNNKAISFTDLNGTEIEKTNEEFYVTYKGELVVSMETSESIDLSKSVIGATEDKRWFHFGEVQREAVESIELLIPKTREQNYVSICPGAKSEEEIYSGCLNEIILSPEKPTSEEYSLIKLNDTEFWRISADPSTFSTGGVGGLDRIISQWHFDEGSGCIANDSVGNNHGTLLSNCPNPISSPSWIPGFSGTAISMLGNTIPGYVSVNNDSSLNTTRFAISTWVNLTAIPQFGDYYGIVTKATSTTNGFQLYVNTRGVSNQRRITFGIGNTFIYGLSEVSNYNPYHIVATYDGSQMSLYINGVLQGTSNANYIQNNANLLIGRRGFGPGPVIRGSVDEVTFYNYSLSAEEVNNIYQGESASCSVIYSNNFQTNDKNDFVSTWDDGLNWTATNDTLKGNHLEYSQINLTSSKPVPNDVQINTLLKIHHYNEHGIVFRHQNNNNFWRLIFKENAVRFDGKVGGVWKNSTLGNRVNFTPTLGVTYHIKLQANSEKLRAKWWPVGDSEPVNWLLYATDNSLLSGQMGYVNRGHTDYDDLTISNCLQSDSLPPSINLTYPNGGESLIAGEYTEIQWGSAYGSGTVKLEHSNDDFNTDINVITPSTIDSGSYVWTTSNSLSNNVKIRISDSTSPLLSDVSDSPFSIVSPPDLTAPTLAEITPVSTPNQSSSPSYTFSADEGGSISYNGPCQSNTTTAVVGLNTITFNTLPYGLYNGCSLTVTDTALNTSNPLNISPFEIIPTSSQPNTNRSTQGGLYRINYIKRKNQYSPPPFTDIKGHWAEDYINEMHKVCQIEGYLNDSGAREFKPNQTISRAEFVTMTLKCLKTKINEPTKKPFKDVNVEAWYARYLHTAKLSKMISGYADGYFRPNKKIILNEALKIVLLSNLSIEEIRNNAKSGAFNCMDIKEQDWFFVYFNYALKNELIFEKESAQECKPKKLVTRAEASRLIIKSLQLSN